MRLSLYDLDIRMPETQLTLENLEGQNSSISDGTIISPSGSKIGLCQCGCGNLAPIAKYTDKKRKRIRGRPYRFIRGHHYREELILSEEGEQIILGSLLGDGSISIRGLHSCAYKEAHCLAQKDYLLWKNQFLKFNISENKERIVIYKQNKIFGEYYKLFYFNRHKTVSLEILNRIDRLGLCCWYLDDGNFNYYHGVIRLYTYGFGLEGNRIIQLWFKDKFDIDCVIQEYQNKPKYKNFSKRDKKYYFLRFNQENTKKFIKIIKPYVHTSMIDKIGLNNLKKKLVKEKKKIYENNRNKIPKRIEEHRRVQKEHYQRNKEKINSRHREYYQINQERIKRHQREYYQKNIEHKRVRSRGYSKEYYKNNRENILKKQKERYYRKKLDIINSNGDSL